MSAMSTVRVRVFVGFSLDSRSSRMHFFLEFLTVSIWRSLHMAMSVSRRPNSSFSFFKISFTDDDLPVVVSVKTAEV